MSQISALHLLTLTFIVSRSYASISSLNLDLVTSETYSGQPAAYIGQVFSVEVTLTLDDIEFEPSHVVLDLELPELKQSDVTCGDEGNYLNGTSYSYQCSVVKTTEGYTNASVNDVIYIIGSAINDNSNDNRLQVITENNNNHYRLNLGLVNVTSGRAPSQHQIQMTLPFIKLDEIALQNHTFNFHATATLTNSTSYTQEMKSSAVLNKIGPQIKVKVKRLTLSEIEAGDSLSFQVKVTHHPDSTQTASNLEVSFWLNEKDHMSALTGTYSGRVSGTLSSADQTILVASFSTSDVITIVFSMTANDTIALNSHVALKATAEYQASGSFQYDVPMKVSDIASNPTKPVTFTSSGGLETIPTDLGAGETVTLAKTIAMPFGTLYFAWFADFYSSKLSKVPLDFTRSNMVIQPYMLADPSLLYVTSSGFVKSARRTKRSISTGVLRDFGGVTNPSATGFSGGGIIVDFTMQVLTNAGDGKINILTGFDISGQPYTWNDLTAFINRPLLILTKTVEVIDDTVLPNIVRINTSVVSDISSISKAHDVTLRDGHPDWSIFWGKDRTGPPIGYPGFTITDDTVWTWKEDTLDYKQSMLMSVEAKPSYTNDKPDLPEGSTNYSSILTYYTSASNTFKITKSAFICITRTDKAKDSIFYNYGFTALTALVGLILGVLLIVLIFFIIIKACRKYPFAGSVQPYSALESRVIVTGTGHGLVTDRTTIHRNTQASKWNDYSAIKSLSSVDVEDSIVKVLAMKPYQAENELENLDIVESCQVDAAIETQRSRALIEANKTLLQNMLRNGDLSSSVVDKALTRFKRALNDLDQNLDATYQKDLAKLYEEISSRNKAKLAALLAKQEQKDEELEESLKDLPEEEAAIMKNLAEEEKRMEKEEISRLLKLEQEEKLEELRKEYGVRKRLGLEEINTDVLKEVTETENLATEQADWLMKEHMKNVVEIKRIYNDEITHQRLILNEKLERRKMLAKKMEIQETDNEEVLKAVEKQQISTIVKVKKQGLVEKGEADELIAEARKNMAEKRKRLDLEKQNMLEDLQHKFNDRKRKRLQEQAKKHKTEMEDLNKKHSSVQTSAFVDPVSLIEERESLLSKQMADRSLLETEIDDEQTEEYLAMLAKLHQDVQQNAVDDKNKACRKFLNKGLDEEELAKILRKHEKDMEKLKADREEQRRAQERNLKEKLEQRRIEWQEKEKKELAEQNGMIEQEAVIVRKLMDNQVAMSEEERDKIMKEHEKQMIKLENNLSLNKLQHKRMLEEKLAKKRAQRLEQLQREHQKETKIARKKAEVDDEDEDAELARLRRQAEERMEVLRGDRSHHEEHLQQIEEELLRERENALQDQEARLGALLANLQLDKAKEMARIEEQQKAIHELKSNLMDDLHEKGVLSDPECQRVIEIHQAEQEKLMEKLEKQRLKQEKKLRKQLIQKLEERENSLLGHQYQEMSKIDEALRSRLATKMKKKEEQMTRMQEKQLNDVMRNTSTANKLRLLALKAKHQNEMQQFREHIERDITQTLEELRRKHEIRRLEVIQDQELQFINGLVRLGKFDMEELQNVLVMLFPTKSEEERKAIMDKLTEGYIPDKDGKKKKPAKKSRVESYEDVPGVRPEPVGRSQTPDLEETYRRAPQSKLPPLGPLAEKKKKKKKANKKKVAAVDDYDENYDNY